MLHYFLAAGVWYYVLKRFGVRLRLQAIATLGLAKLFLDQVLPTAGIGGTVLVVRGLTRRGAPSRLATASVLVDHLSFYAAHALAVGLGLFILWMHREVSAGILLLAAMFSVVAVAVPILILLLTRKGKRFVPAWAFRFPGLKEIIKCNSFRSAGGQQGSYSLTSSHGSADCNLCCGRRHSRCPLTRRGIPDAAGFSLRELFNGLHNSDTQLYTRGFGSI